MKENPLKLFDMILENLANSEYGISNFKDLIENISPEVKIKEEDLSKNIGRVFLEDKKPLKIIGALYYLKEEKYINYNEGTKPVHNTSIVITQKGLIKILTNGFLKEYKRSVWNHRIERFNKLITPVIAFCAFLIALINLLFSYFY